MAEDKSLFDVLLDLAAKGGRGVWFGLLYALVAVGLAVFAVMLVKAHDKIWLIAACGAGALVFGLLTLWAFSPADKKA